MIGKFKHKMFALSRVFSILLLVYSLIPAISYAFPTNLADFNTLFFETFDILVPILIGVAFLIFFWGVAKFILAAGNEKELAAGRQFMIWGILGLFILVSFWGIMQFLAAQFDFGCVGWPSLPTGGGAAGCQPEPQGVANSSITFPDINN